MAITAGYCTLAEIKAFRGVTDSSEDTMLERAVEAASRAIDRYAGHPDGDFLLDSSTSTRTFQVCARGVEIRCDPIGTTTGLVLKPEAADGTLGTAITTYRTFPLNALTHSQPITRLVLTSGWMAQPYAQVTAKWGWPAVPAKVTQACLILAARMAKRRESAEGTMGFGEFGMRISREDPDVVELLREFRPMLVG